MQVMKAHGVTRFFHFTDVSNLESIKKHGLVPWVSLSSEVKSVNSSDTSRKLDAEKGLSNFVRLSFCKRSPMMFVALKDRRIVRPVILEIKLEVVSRPGVLFCEQNAAAKNAWPSPDPRVVNFDVVKAKSYFDIPKKHQYPYQAEVLVHRRYLRTSFAFLKSMPGTSQSLLQQLLRLPHKEQNLLTFL